MADVKSIEQALINADAAGDVRAATLLAKELQRLRVPSPQPDTSQAINAVAKEVGPFESLAISSGRVFDKTAMGLTQGALAGVKAIGPESFAKAADTELQALAKREDDNDRAFAALQNERPYTTAIGGALPGVVATLGMGTIPAAMTFGTLEALQYGTPEERALRGVVGAGASAFGSAVGKTIGRVFAPGRAFSEAQRAALRESTDMGVSPRLSQATGSQWVARIEDMVARLPGGAGVMSKFQQGNQQAINRTAAGAIGQNADELTPAVFQAAREQLGRVFQEIKTLGQTYIGGRSGPPIRINRNVGNAADIVLRTQAKLPAEMQNAGVISMAETAKRMSGLGARIDGEAYQLIRSNLTDASHGAFRAGDSTMGKAYQSLLSALDDSADSSLQAAGRADLARALREVRPMWANLVTLEKGLVAEAGNVSPARLATALRGNNPQAFREGGGGALGAIGRYGEAFKPLQAGSPTFERSIVNSPIATALSAPLAWAGARATTSPMMTTIPRAMATASPQVRQGMGLLGDVADPAVRAALLGLLQRPGMGLLGAGPVMAE